MSAWVMASDWLGPLSGARDLSNGSSLQGIRV